MAQAAKPRWAFDAQAGADPALEARVQELASAKVVAGAVHAREAGARRGPRRRCSRRCCAAVGARRDGQGARSASYFEKVEKAEVRRLIVEKGIRVDGRSVKEIRPISTEVGVPAARPRLGALHARRDPGPGRGHARHQERRAEDRVVRGRRLPALHAALQLPVVLDRRGEAVRHPGPPRDRPRRARRAGRRGGAADQGGVPVHDPRRLRDPRVQRLLLDGHASAAPPWR